MLRLETLPGVLEATGSKQQSVFTVDLDADSYDLIVRAVRTRIDRGLYTTTTEGAWRVLRAAMSQGPPWRLSMEREEAESLCEWFEKTYDVVSALTDRWPDARKILDAALRGVRAISAAIP
jgi:hypothetical protein